MKWTCLTDSHSSNISSFYQTDSVKYQLNALGSQHLDKLPPRPFGFYAITRFNPLFTEETDRRIEKTSIRTRTDAIKYEGKRDRSKYYLHKSALCEDSYTVLERNSDLISRVLVSVRIGGRYRRQISSNGLAPIPEGEIDLIPRPIWPQDENKVFKKGEDITVETNVQANFRDDVTEPAQTRGVRKSETLYVGRKSSLSKMLREISEGSSINVTMTSVEGAADLPAKIVLQSLLHGKMDDYLEDSSRTQTMPRHFSQCKSTNVFGGDQVAMFHRALRLVEKYYERSPNIIEKRKYQSFQGSGMFTDSSSNSCYEPTQESSSSSSSVATRISTTGISDLTQTPISSNSSSSSSEFSTARRIILKNNNVTRALRNERTHRNDVVELHDDEGLVGKNGSCDDASSDVKKSVSFNTFQCRIVPINRTGYCTQSASSAQFKHTEITNFIDDINIKSESQLSSFPGRRCPDFTLDVHQAEKVSKEIKYKEKERCWCRILTSCAGFVLLLFAVMFFSMMLTRGERIFGSL